MEIHRRDDVDPEDGIRKYGDVEFADPVNKKFPLDTPEHVRSAWSKVHTAKCAPSYSLNELELIKSRIMLAASRLGVELLQEMIERDAKLFAAGSYPDRGIDVTEADLDQMVAGHQPVPIKVEHTDSPLELGAVTKLWRVGKELFGKLVFTAPAWSLLVSSGARKLSAAIKKDKSGLTEVSLVRVPRIADAAVFSGSDDFYFTVEEEVDKMPETKVAEFSKRITDLERQLKCREVDSQIDSLKRAGKLVPASEEFARAILLNGDAQSVTFSDGSVKPLAETFAAFLESQPCVVEFSELATGAEEHAEVSDAERELCAKLGISPEAVVKHRAR